MILKMFIALVLAVPSCLCIAGGQLRAVIPQVKLFNEIAGYSLYTNSCPPNSSPCVFPDNSYIINDIELSKIKKISGDEKLNGLDTNYKLATRGKLELITYNKETRHFKFKLALKTYSLIDDTNSLSSGSKTYPLSGKISFDLTHLNVAYIEGKFHSYGEKWQITNIMTKDNPGFTLTFYDGKELSLNQSSEIPVTVFVD